MGKKLCPHFNLSINFHKKPLFIYLFIIFTFVFEQK